MSSFTIFTFRSLLILVLLVGKWFGLVASEEYQASSMILCLLYLARRHHQHHHRYHIKGMKLLRIDLESKTVGCNEWIHLIEQYNRIQMRISVFHFQDIKCECPDDIMLCYYFRFWFLTCVIKYQILGKLYVIKEAYFHNLYLYLVMWALNW